MITRCGNPECPSGYAEMTMSHHWVQVEELQFQQIGNGPASTGAVQRLFAAAACSKRYAAAVLTAAADAIDATRGTAF